MTIQLSCPFCNTAVPVAELPPSRRVVCPRCGEAFPVRTPDPGEEPHLPAASLNGEPAPAPPPVPERPLVGWPALFGLVVGVAVIAVGMYAILRKPGTATAPTGPGGPKPAVTMPPAAVPGLAYLPAETSVAFALQPASRAASAERSGTDPKEVLGRAGVPESVTSALDRLGLRPEQVDSFCGGAVAAKDKPFRAFVVLALREPPADRSAFHKQLKATQTTAASGQTRYNVELGGFPLTMTEPDPRTFLFATDPADLESAPGRAGKGSAHLPAGLRESMGRLSPASFAWVATDTDQWSENPWTKAAAGLLEVHDLPARLAGVRAAAVGVSTEPELRLTAAVRAADPAAADKLRDRVAAAVAGPAQGKLQLGGDGPWVTAEGPPDKDVWSAALRAAGK